MLARAGRVVPLRATCRLRAARGVSHGTAKLDWETMLFDYVQTNCHVEYNFKDGQWDAGVMKTSPMVETHIMSNCYHYGQTLFEGLKVFSCKDGSVRCFQPWNANAERLAAGCRRLSMPVVPTETFNDAIARVVKENLEFVPPYGTGGALYIRPFSFGHGPKLGLGAAPEYKFIVMVNPVGNYYSGGLTAIPGLVQSRYDRAAPRGLGNVKAGGNYAADLVPATEAKDEGYPICLYLDAAEQKFVEEFSTSNFLAISADGALVSPQSDSILPSVTKRALLQIAQDAGLRVEVRPVSYEEVATFREVVACGTAVVLTPISSLTRNGETIKFGSFSTFQMLYDRIRAIQVGDADDVHGWNTVVA